MAPPLVGVFRRGAVFLWLEYAYLDDPTLAGQAKEKYTVVLSHSAEDDPILYLLTTSEKPKHANHPRPEDLLTIQSGTYRFFSKTTLIDVAAAGELEIDSSEFKDLYDSGLILHKGQLSNEDIQAIEALIRKCRLVVRRSKQVLGCN